MKGIEVIGAVITLLLVRSLQPEYWFYTLLGHYLTTCVSVWPQLQPLLQHKNPQHDLRSLVRRTCLHDVHSVQ
jgi:hypothetical protein